MSKQQLIRKKFPAFRWMLLLFLAAGISLFYNGLPFGRPVLTEQVDRLIFNAGKKKNVAAFAVRSLTNRYSRKSAYPFSRIKLLSRKMDNDVHIILNRQTCSFSRLLLRIPFFISNTFILLSAVLPIFLISFPRQMFILHDFS